MADEYLSDLEQEEALRNWWRENWRWIVGGVVLGLALLAGWQYYNTHRDNRAAAAATEYEKVRAAVEKQDVAQATAALAELTADHDSTAYAQQARMLVAKVQVDAGKFEEAAALLQAAIDKGEDEVLARVARLRLARVMIQQGKYDDVLKMLDTESAGALAAQVREIRGDAMLAKGDRAAAKAEYAAALASNADAQTDRTLLELKLQDVNDAPAAASEPATAAAGSQP